MEAMALRATLAISRGQNHLACSLGPEMEDHAATAVSFPTEDLLRQLRHQVEAHVANLTAPSNTVSAVGRADVPGELTLPWPEPLWTWQESVWSNPGAATTLAGLLAKGTGQAPFIIPGKLRQAASPTFHKLPICFLSNADTTGGNSGSPVLDGQGRFVGINFDRVYENVSGDFGYRRATSRNVMTDVRYILFYLRRVAKADAVLRELGVK